MQTYPHFDPQLPKSMWVLPKILEMQAAERRDKVYLTVPERGLAFTFGEMNALANRMARGLAARAGVARGDRVTLMMPNSPEFITAWFAAAKLGAVEAPINNAYKGSFLEHQVNIAGASVAVISHDQVPVWRDSIGRMPNMRTIVVWSGTGEPLGDCPIGDCRVIDYSAMFDDREDDLGIEVLPSDISSIIYTSGTTGLSKGVMMPHAQFYLFAESDIQLVKLRSDDIYMTSLPLFHGNAQFLTVYPTLITGSQCVLYSKFSASRWVDHLHESKATVTNTIGVILPFAAAQPPTDRDNTHSLERVLATPTPPDAEYFKKRFGIGAFADAFGQTEICAPIMSPLGVSKPAGACGLAVPQWFDIRIVDPTTDEDVPDGQTGELVVRHKQPWTLNAGYIGMPEKTAEACRNLWFHTGDAMKRDAEGWYYFVDRIKDALRRRGENISSFEIEAPMLQHPMVEQVAVIGVPAEVAGGEDEVKACVVLKKGTALEPQALIDWCEARIPAFMVPRYIEFLDDLPKTPSEKIQKKKLREDGITDKTWDRLAQDR